MIKAQMLINNHFQSLTGRDSRPRNSAARAASMFLISIGKNVINIPKPTGTINANRNDQDRICPVRIRNNSSAKQFCDCFMAAPLLEAKNLIITRWRCRTCRPG